jgi:hypothetical protein
MKREAPFNIDADPMNADWTKQSWDLPDCKSPAFFRIVPKDTLDNFRTLPVYRWATRKGLIRNDEWTGVNDETTSSRA